MTTLTAKESGTSANPITFSIVLWHAYLLSTMFLLYGGVKLLLGILDRQYDDMLPSGLFFGIGLLIVNIAWRFRERDWFGWYGLLAVNGAIVVMGLWGAQQEPLNLVLMVSSLIMLTLALLPATKSRFSRKN